MGYRAGPLKGKLLVQYGSHMSSCTLLCRCCALVGDLDVRDE